MYVSGQAESAEAQVADLESQLKDIQNLNARLEEDLLAAERSNRIFRNGSGGANEEAASLSTQQGASVDFSCGL